MARDSSVDLGSGNSELDVNRSKQWTSPPVLSEDPASSIDQGFVMTQGIIYSVSNKGKALFQNVSENEDDSIEFSFHGDKDGLWGLLIPGSFLEVTGDIYLLNRTHKQNCKIAVIVLG